MAAAKITIRIPTEQVAEISSLVEGCRVASASVFVKHAISVALADAAG